ncbi:hypothetical protein [Kluyvera sichuanensis]|uniref:hypothetical protein n=1 Tax=Kluyvera sichuanensis TaxID=2725494 RepID=UPI002FCFD476
MEIELITTKQFIEQAECYFNNYMLGLLMNAPDGFYYALNNKNNMNDIMENVIKIIRYRFYDETDEGRMNRVSGEVSYSKVKQHLRRLWIIYKCVYR